MMFKRKEIIIAFVLGIIIPFIIFTMVDKMENKQTSVGHQPTLSNVFKPSNKMISVLMENNNVENIELEEYLKSVVLREMPANFELEALKAQAVVARTYALRKIQDGRKHKNADVCTNSECCQGFLTVQAYLSKDGDADLLNKVISAVESTAGQILVYDGELIDATYFSSSGGRTEDAKAVWGADIPYLQSAESPGEENATHYVDTKTYTLTEFGELLGTNLSGKPTTWIGDITYTAGGGVDTIYICGKEYKGTTLRQRLGLRSTAFTISIVGTTVTITTKGYGHRVGMSQYGADAMAVQGSTYDQILSHYYKGTELIIYDGN